MTQPFPHRQKPRFHQAGGNLDLKTSMSCGIWLNRSTTWNIFRSPWPHIPKTGRISGPYPHHSAALTIASRYKPRPDYEVVRATGKLTEQIGYKKRKIIIAHGTGNLPPHPMSFILSKIKSPP
jgi:hypothetical protein